MAGIVTMVVGNAKQTYLQNDNDRLTVTIIMGRLELLMMTCTHTYTQRIDLHAVMLFLRRRSAAEGNVSKRMFRKAFYLQFFPISGEGM